MTRLGVVLVLCATTLTATAGATAAAAGAGADCPAPAPVCAARERVFPVASFDPVGSAVLLEPGLLVTNRHVVADNDGANVFLPDGTAVPAAVLPTTYPGDLVLLQASSTRFGPAAPIAIAPAVAEGARVYAVGGDIAGGGAKVFPPGEVILAPAPDRPLARLHHLAPSEPGNGGALVDERGRLVGVIASGGTGPNEAIPATEIARLRRLSGLEHYPESQRLGSAYRRCMGAIERARNGEAAAPGASPVDAVAAPCVGTGNPQLHAMAGRLLAVAGRLGDALALYEASLDQDPNALDALIGRATTLHLGLHFERARPTVDRLLTLLPDDRDVLHLALQAAEWGGDAELAARAHARLEQLPPPDDEAAVRPAPRAQLGADRGGAPSWPPDG